MSEYRVKRPAGGKAFAVLFAIGIVMGLAILTGEKRSGVWTASIPVIVLACYGAALLWRNEHEISVTREGLRLRTGPLPAFERERWIPKETVARVYVRSFTLTGKHGGRFRTAGVELRNGDSLDIAISCPPDPAMEDEAKKIAEALAWREGIVRLDERGRAGLRWAAVWPVLRAFGLVALCAAWAYWVMNRR